ncbi:MAG: GntR family transcriptional regulator [Actinobacteria bacterium]|nr:GntR family transcriptional regulator [Actinomycetota bacterium]
MSSQLSAIDRRGFADRVYEALRGSVLAGEFRPGEHLVETELAERLGVSRVPVREALQKLKSEGLVEDAPGRGLCARRFSAADVADIYNLRLGLEPIAARLTTCRAEPVEPLEELIGQMRDASEEHRDVAAMTAIEMKFHRKICELSGNQILAHSFAAAAAQIQLAMSVDNDSVVDGSDLAAEHQVIVDAIAAGDPDRASRVMIEHILSTVDQVFDGMGEGEQVEEARARLLWGLREG